MNRKCWHYFLYRRLRYRFTGDISPLAGVIKITQRCNLACTHCVWHNRIKDDLPLEIWLNIIDYLYDRGCGMIVIEGGEPLLKEDVYEIIRYVKSKKMFCILITNGTQAISEVKVDSLWLSIEGTREVHDRIRGRGVFDKAMRNIELNPDKKMFSLTTLSKTNYQEIEPLCEILSKTNLKGLLFNFAYPYKDMIDEALPLETRRECAKLIMDLQKEYPQIPLSRSYLAHVGMSGEKRCYSKLFMTVTADGKITHGCTVEAVEKRNCAMCDMGCIEGAKAFDLYDDALNFWHRTVGLPKILVSFRFARSFI